MLAAMIGVCRIWGRIAAWVEAMCVAIDHVAKACQDEHGAAFARPDHPLDGRDCRPQCRRAVVAQKPVAEVEAGQEIARTVGDTGPEARLDLRCAVAVDEHRQQMLRPARNGRRDHRRHLERAGGGLGVIPPGDGATRQPCEFEPVGCDGVGQGHQFVAGGDRHQLGHVESRFVIAQNRIAEVDERRIRDLQLADGLGDAADLLVGGEVAGHDAAQAVEHAQRLERLGHRCQVKGRDTDARRTAEARMIGQKHRRQGVHR